MRQDLLDRGMVTNPNEYKWYNGIWANVKNPPPGRKATAIPGLASPAENHGLVGTFETR